MSTSWMERAAAGFESVLMLKHENGVLCDLRISTLHVTPVPT